MNLTIRSVRSIDRLSNPNGSTRWAVGPAGKDLTHIEGHLRFLQLEKGCRNLVIEGKTSAQILEQILLDRWMLEANDREEVVMVHKLGLKRSEEHTSELQSH